MRAAANSAHQTTPAPAAARVSCLGARRIAARGRLRLRRACMVSGAGRAVLRICVSEVKGRAMNEGALQNGVPTKRAAALLLLREAAIC